MMRNVMWKVLLITGLIASILIIDIYAEEIPLQKKTYSSGNGKYVVELKIAEDWPDNYGNCHATFSQIKGVNKKIIWKRNLINDYAPSKIYISNSGKYVVTLDEYNPGYLAKLPLVIYGGRGYLINVLSFKDFLTPEELNEHPAFMPLHGGSWWRDELVLFSPQDDTIFVRLHWGRVFAIQDGLVIAENKWEDQKSWVKSEVEAICLKKLQSRYPNERYTGALIAGQEKIKSTIPLLREMLNDMAHYESIAYQDTWDRTLHYWLRAAAIEALSAFGIKGEGVVLEAKKYKDRKLTAVGAIAKAREYAEEQGYNLFEYDKPSVVKDKRNDQIWIVSFSAKAAIEGGFFTVYVHEKTHDANLVPGK